MTVSEAKRLKALEMENAKLNGLVADQQLDILVLKDIVSKKW
jgi:putative transposase